ncbi:MAG: HDOD domain-containing protein [Methylococcales bacterium]|jgi:HD-like signal output (HDOD) protein
MFLNTLAAFYRSLQRLLALPQNLLFGGFERIFSSSSSATEEDDNEAAEEINELLNPDSISKDAIPVIPVFVTPTARTAPIYINTTEPQTVRSLRKFAPLRYLSESMLEQIDQQTLHYTADSVVFITGEITEYAFYLLHGSVELHPEGIFPYTVNVGTPQAGLPLNSGFSCGSTVVTTAPCIILAVSRIFLQRLTQQKYRYTLGNEFIKSNLPRDLPNNRFFADFAHAYRENSLSLPSLPQVASRLRQALQDPDVTIVDVINIVQFDATIVAKLIQVANSVFYAAEAPITNCHNAVLRLGLEATRRVVMGISVKHLFYSQNKQLMSMMQSTWRSSIYLSSLCYILAKESKTVNPEDALLAGLICDIGRIPVLNFAEEQLDYSPDLRELKTALPFLSPPVGTLMLHNLDFSADLINIPKFSEDWFYESGEEQLTLIDIVILAKLHSYFGSKKAKYLPYLNTIPAYVKLNKGKLNGDFSLNVLHQAQARIYEAMTFFS